MLGILLIGFIGKAYFDLATAHNRTAWAYAILGVVAYYLTTFIVGIIMYILGDLTGSFQIDESNELLLSLLAIPFGLLGTFLLYKFLESRRFKRAALANKNVDSDILDENMFK